MIQVKRAGLPEGQRGPSRGRSLMRQESSVCRDDVASNEVGALPPPRASPDAPQRRTHKPPPRVTLGFRGWRLRGSALLGAPRTSTPPIRPLHPSQGSRKFLNWFLALKTQNIRETPPSASSCKSHSGGAGPAAPCTPPPVLHPGSGATCSRTLVPNAL